MLRPTAYAAISISFLVACSSDSTPTTPNSTTADAYGKPCSNPINSGGGGSSGGGGGGGSTADGGVDPACTGTYDICASIGGTIKCTRPCTYPGGANAAGPMAAPECTNPPTNGMCTPRGFCQ